MTSYVENESGITFDFDIEELALNPRKYWIW